MDFAPPASSHARRIVPKQVDPNLRTSRMVRSFVCCRRMQRSGCTVMRGPVLMFETMFETAGK